IRDENGSKAGETRGRAGDESALVSVEISVREGPQTFVRRVEYTGLTQLDPADAALAVDVFESELESGDPLLEEALESARQQLSDLLHVRGYARAAVDVHAKVDVPTSRATVAVTVEAGAQFDFGEVRIVGLGGIPEGPVRQAL